jgi:hypothetical protein
MLTAAADELRIRLFTDYWNDPNNPEVMTILANFTGLAVKTGFGLGVQAERKRSGGDTGSTLGRRLH